MASAWGSVCCLQDYKRTALRFQTHLQGFDVAKQALLDFLDAFKTTADPADREVSAGLMAQRLLACLQTYSAVHAVSVLGSCIVSVVKASHLVAQFSNYIQAAVA